MTDLLEDITVKINDRLQELKPLVEEFEQIEAALRSWPEPVAPKEPEPNYLALGIEQTERAVRAMPGARFVEIADHTKMFHDTVRGALSELEKYGRVRCVRRAKKAPVWFPVAP